MYCKTYQPNRDTYFILHLENRIVRCNLSCLTKFEKNETMSKHTFWMIIGCTVPLLLIFLLPLFGITGNHSIFIFIVFMFACHLLMPMHHGGDKHDGHKEHSETDTTANH